VDGFGAGVIFSLCLPDQERIFISPADNIKRKVQAGLTRVLENIGLKSQQEYPF
jgi:hypothetical protein